MAELVREGKTRFISLQMEYSLFSRDAEEQGQIDACKELGLAMMAYAVLGREMLSAELPGAEEMPADDVRARLPRFESANLERNLPLRSALEAIARRKSATLAQLAIA
jgi:aryl-alcohol dehydrogenase-like predicted oxidoreductase